MDITQNGDRWELRPTRSMLMGGLAVSVFATVLTALCACGYFHGAYAQEGWILTRLFGVGGVIMALMAVGSCTRGIHYWLQRSTPLVVERSGRVSYGGEEVCAGGTVRTVLFETRHGDDADYYSVTLQTTDAKAVELPAPYFDELAFQTDLGRATSVAEELAKALRVECEQRVGD